ncbi:Tetratricopeptide repeat protein [Pelomyxa schiedti]|nr:Tetratricopeptide repeat protein [Pelomyxa schiedti]
MGDDDVVYEDECELTWDDPLGFDEIVRVDNKATSASLQHRDMISFSNNDNITQHSGGGGLSSRDPISMNQLSLLNDAVHMLIHRDPIRLTDAVPEKKVEPPKEDKATGLYDYEATCDTELSFKEGDQIEILEKDDSGWYMARCGSKTGFIPGNYVEIQLQHRNSISFSEASSSTQQPDTNEPVSATTEAPEPPSINVNEDMCAQMESEREALFIQQQALLESLSGKSSSTAKEIPEQEPALTPQSNFLDTATLSYATVPAAPLFHSDVAKPEKKKRQKVEDRCIRLFISSTFKDMVLEREGLIKRVMPYVRSACARKGILIREVDLRWGITAEQSESGNTISICLSEIDRCRPWFFCLLGQRYGWSHSENSRDALLTKTFANASSKFPWIMKFQDRSITELEVRHAILNKEQPSEYEQSHCAFFFRDPAVTQGRGPDFEEPSPILAGRLQNLKDEITARHPGNIHSFSTPSSLESEFQKQIMEMIDRDFPETNTPTPLEREREVHDAFARSRHRIYVGGEQYIFRINCLLASQAQNQHPTPIVIVGDSGSGKSALVCNFVVRYQNENPDAFVVAHYIGCSGLSTDLGRMLHRIISEILDFFELPAKDIPNDLEGLKTLLPSVLVEASLRGGMLLVIDALNQLDNKDNAQELDWLPTQFPPNVQLITSLLPSRASEVIAQRKWHIVKVEAMEERERRELISSYMSECSKSLSSSQVDSILGCQQTSNPLFLKTVLDEIRVHGAYETIDKRIGQCLSASNIPALLGLVLSRIEADSGANRRYLQETLALIWLSRKGLSETEVIGITGVSPVVWSEIMLSLSELLGTRAGMMNFSHDFVKQSVASKYITAELSSVLRKKMVDYFLSLDSLERKCDEIPYHLLQEKKMKELAGFITLPANFLLLTSEQFLFDLYKYFRSCKEASPASMLLPQMMPSTNPLHLRQAGKFLQDLAYFTEAEVMLTRANSLFVSGTIPLNLTESADVKDALGYLYRMQAKYDKSIPMYEEALNLRKKLFGESSAEVASSMCSLAILFRKMGKYDQAEPLYMGSCVIRKKLLGLNNPETAVSYNGLGCLYQDQGKDKLAEEHFAIALRIREHCHGPSHPDVAMTLSNMGSLYLSRAKYAEAEHMFQRALSIYEDIFGENHPDVAHTLGYLAGVCVEKGKYSQAKALFERTIAIKEQAFGKKHPEVAQTLSDFGVLHARLKDYDKALSLYKQCLEIRREILGPDHPDTAQSMNNVAAILSDNGQYKEAEEMLKEALQTTERKFGGAHPNLCNTLLKLAKLYQKQNRSGDLIIPLYQRTLNILKKQYGEVHPDIAVTLNDMAVLNYRLGQPKKAEQLYLQMVEVLEKLFPQGHPDVANACKNVAAFYAAIGKFAQQTEFLTKAANQSGQSS